MNIFLTGILILVLAQFILILVLMTKSQRAQQQILERMKAQEYDQHRSGRNLGSSSFITKKVYIQEEDGKWISTQTSTGTFYIPAVNEKVSFENEAGTYLEARVSSIHEHTSEECTQIVIFIRNVQRKELPIYLDNLQTTLKEDTK